MPRTPTVHGGTADPTYDRSHGPYIRLLDPEVTQRTAPHPTWGDRATDDTGARVKQPQAEPTPPRPAPGHTPARGSQPDDPPCLSVVIPAYNEITTIEEVIGAVLASPYTQEIVVVDDGSTDGTREVLEKLDHPKVRVILQPHNQGKGAALRRGFQEACAAFVIVQDADLEYDPAEYGELLAPLLADKADVVYGSRFLTGRPHRVLYFWHSIGNRLLTLTSNMFTDLNLSDMETCYKVFRREVLDSFTLEEDRFGIEPEMTAKVAAGRWRIFETGISYHGRTYDEGKKIGWRDGFRAFYCIVRYSPLGQRVLSHGPARSRAERNPG